MKGSRKHGVEADIPYGAGYVCVGDGPGEPELVDVAAARRLLEGAYIVALALRGPGGGWLFFSGR